MVFDRAVRAGAKAIKTPDTSMYHGHVRASVRDPEGNRWRFVQPDRASKSKKPSSKKAPTKKAAKAAAKPRKGGKKSKR